MFHAHTPEIHGILEYPVGVPGEVGFHIEKALAAIVELHEHAKIFEGFRANHVDERDADEVLQVPREFEAVQDLVTQNDYGGVRMVYRVGLGDQLADLKRAQIIHIDLGNGDPITPSPREVKTTAHIFDEPLSWKVYPLESIGAEKLHGLFAHGSQNSRSKDVFDLHVLLPQANVGLLRHAIVNTFTYRGDSVPNLLGLALKEIDRTTLRRGWRSAMRDFSSPPDFDEAFNVILFFLQTHGI